MKLLVTGGAGFIGSNFILYWTAHHPEDFIVNFDALTYAGNLENLVGVDKNANYQFIHGNICNPTEVARAMDGIDTVVHFAAESHVDRSILDAQPFVTTNVLGTYNLLHAAVHAQVKRFHHISTDEVFGSLELDDTSKFNERTLYNPRSPYSASKAGSDHLVRSFFHTFNLPITITNCSNNYGSYQFPEKFIALCITNILEGKKIPLYGDGLYVRDWLHVEDHCRAIEMVLTNGRVGETYCVGGNSPGISNKDIVEKILKRMGKDRSLIEHVKDRPGHDRRYAIDSSKIEKELGWKPLYDVDTGLIKTIEWYKEHVSWWQRIKSGEYKDYYEKQYGVHT